MLTEAELEVAEQLAAAYNAFVKLPRCRVSELIELVAHFHALQHILMCRAAVRAHPDAFTHVESFE